MGVRLVSRVSVTPPRALDGRNTNYFADRTQANLQTSMGRDAAATKKRIQSRIESEEFGQDRKYGWGHSAAEHTGRTVGAVDFLAQMQQTSVKAKNKGTIVSFYLNNTRMPWPLLTNWPLGIPQKHKNAPFRIKPRKDRQGTGKSRKKRLVFFWNNKGVEFWGKQVIHPGFGPDILTEELTAFNARVPEHATTAVSRSVVEFTKGGSKATPVRSNVYRRSTR